MQNVNEAGSLTITPSQPLAGSPATAVLTDPDGIVTITDWRWATSSTDVGEFPEDGRCGWRIRRQLCGEGRRVPLGDGRVPGRGERRGCTCDRLSTSATTTWVHPRGHCVVETGHDSDERLTAGSDNAVQTVQAVQDTGTTTVHTSHDDRP